MFDACRGIRTRTADAAADTAVTQAEGDNKVALEKCG